VGKGERIEFGAYLFCGNWGEADGTDSHQSKCIMVTDECDEAVAESLAGTRNESSASERASTTSHGASKVDGNSAEDNIDNDPEVILLTKFRLALGSTLRMLECARDDLVRLGERMDRLTVASRECRENLETQQAQQQQTQHEHSEGEAQS